MRLFDVLGPVMIGPSSSHTAGAVRIGLVARRLLGEAPTKAVIRLHGSFALTGQGHGTDRALVAGLLGMQPDDPGIPFSLETAQEQGLQISFASVTLRNAHPNTAALHLVGATRSLDIVVSSIGGGRIRICEIDGIEANFSAEQNTLIVHNSDTPGHVATITTILAQHHINIATMQLFRSAAGGYAVMVLECDEHIPQHLAALFEQLPGIIKATVFNQEDE